MKKPARACDLSDDELRAIIERGRRVKPSQATHRLAFEYAMAMVAAGGDAARVPLVPWTRH